MMRAPLFAVTYLMSYVTEASAKAEKRDERGAAVTEYVVLIAFVVGAAALLAATGIWDTVGTKIKDLIDGVTLAP